MGGQKFLFWQLGPENAHPQNTIKKWFQHSNFWKTVMRHETAIFGQKNPNPEIPVIICFAYFLLFQQQKHKTLLKPLFYSVLANLKKENFQNLNSKHWKWKNPIFAPFFERGYLRKLQDNWAQKKTQNDNWAKKSPETPILIVRKQTWPW